MNELRRRVMASKSKELPLGVWAYYSNGTLKSESEADSNAIGVALITENCRFVIDKTVTNGGNTIYYGGYNKNLSNIGVVVTSDKATAMLDFDGESNTTKIITACAGYTHAGVTGAPAAEACRAAFNGHGYMGSTGEMYEAYTNRTAINSMMTKIGGTAINSGYYWTSTLYDASTKSWRQNFGTGRTFQNDRNNYWLVRAFRAL